MSPTQDDGMAELPKLAFSIKMLRQVSSLAYLYTVQIRPLKENFEIHDCRLWNRGHKSGDLLVIDRIDNVASSFIMPHYACIISHTVERNPG